MSEADPPEEDVIDDRVFALRPAPTSVAHHGRHDFDFDDGMDADAARIASSAAAMHYTSFFRDMFRARLLRAGPPESHASPSFAHLIS